MILENIRCMLIFARVPRGGGVTVKRQWACRTCRSAQYLLQAICSETLDMQDIQPFGGYSVILNFVTLNEPEP